MKKRALKSFGKYVVDGLNVCYYRPPQPSLAVLLTLLQAIRQKGGSFICIFDASTPHHLYRFVEKDAVQALIKNLPNNFVMAPAGMKADAFILPYCNEKNLPIISNDQFKDYAKDYPWLKSDRSRRIAGTVIGDMISIPNLKISAPVKHDVVAATRQLIQSQSAPPSVSPAVVKVKVALGSEKELHHQRPSKKPNKKKPTLKPKTKKPTAIKKPAAQKQQKNRNSLPKSQARKTAKRSPRTKVKSRSLHSEKPSPVKKGIFATLFGL